MTIHKINFLQHFKTQHKIGHLYYSHTLEDTKGMSFSFGWRTDEDMEGSKIVQERQKR
jgi:hypothetical protein